MKPTTMKPETIKRRAKERATARVRRTKELHRRLAEKAEKDPDGIWTDLARAVIDGWSG